ncbi:MAG: hypothetical protein V1846_00185 [Candidatus Komeilibacteria bacterium]
MNRNARDIAVACFIGGSALVLLSLILIPTLWWLAFPAGAAIGYFGWRFSQSVAGFKLAWTRYWRGLDLQETLTDIKDVSTALSRAIVAVIATHLLGVLGLISGMVLLCLLAIVNNGQTLKADFIPLYKEGLTEFIKLTPFLTHHWGWLILWFSVITFVGYMFLAMSAESLFYQLAKRKQHLVHDLVSEHGNYDHHPEVRISTSRLFFYALRFVLYGWLVWYLVPGTIFLVRHLIRGVAWLVLKLAILLIIKLPILLFWCLIGLPGFIWNIFRFIHTRERLVVAVDTFLGGGAVAWWLHQSQLQLPLWQNLLAVIFGGLAASIIGVVNYQLVGVKWLKTLPSATERSEI